MSRLSGSWYWWVTLAASRMDGDIGWSPESPKSMTWARRDRYGTAGRRLRSHIARSVAELFLWKPTLTALRRNVVRTEWSTSASSWEQGRSTPAVAGDSEGLKAGRHQCFEVGAWICVSDVYVGSLIRRLAGRRSPVASTPLRRSYQSVVLDVGIWYAESMVIDSPVYADSPVY